MDNKIFHDLIEQIKLQIKNKVENIVTFTSCSKINNSNCEKTLLQKCFINLINIHIYRITHERMGMSPNGNLIH